ncbi:MAG: NADH-quinone oxidoreductase subunit B family protein [Candidatus Hodarchaeales archaeon]
MTKARIATDWLCICSGCEVSLLDIDEAILKVLELAEIVRCPVLMDVKEFVPADVGVISGGIRNEQNIAVAKKMRENCDVIVSLGSCGVYGGIPGLANLYTTQEIYDHVFETSLTTDNPLSHEPRDDLPPLTEKVTPLSSVIKVDYEVPGCPPVPELITAVLIALLHNEEPEFTNRSICDGCVRQAHRTNAKPKRLRRWYESSGDCDPIICFNEQGYICLGPVTRNLCAARCLDVGVPCRGCHGPLPTTIDSGLDALNMLATLGTETPGGVKGMRKALPDPAGQLYMYTFATAKPTSFVKLHKR